MKELLRQSQLPENAKVVFDGEMNISVRGEITVTDTLYFRNQDGMYGHWMVKPDDDEWAAAGFDGKFKLMDDESYQFVRNK